jgi:hypothetical protein
MIFSIKVKMLNQPAVLLQLLVLFHLPPSKFMCYFFKELVSKMKSPSAVDDGLHCLKTDKFTLHHYETQSGLRFVLNTDPQTPDLRSSLLDVYGLFVDLVAKNPSYDPASEEPFDSPMFEKALGDYLEGLACFR